MRKTITLPKTPPFTFLVLLLFSITRLAAQSLTTGAWTANGITLTLNWPQQLQRGDMVHWIFPDGNFENLIYSGSGPLTVQFRPTKPYNCGANNVHVSCLNKGGLVPPPPVTAPVTFGLACPPPGTIYGTGTRLRFPPNMNVQLNNAWDWTPENENFLVLSYRNAHLFPQGLTLNFDPSQLIFIPGTTIASYGESIQLLSPGLLRIDQLSNRGDNQIYLRFRAQNMGPRARFNVTIGEDFAYQGIVNAQAHDPNYKLPDHEQICALQSERIATGYEVRFQNIGDWYAQDVLVTDELPGALDPQTVSIQNSDTDMYYELLDNRLMVAFPGIELPGLGQIYPERFAYDQTYHTFHIDIQTNKCLPEGNINNECHIYFDDLDPVVTNVATTLVQINDMCGMSCAMSNSKSDDRGMDMNLLREGIFPNPSTTSGTLSLMNTDRSSVVLRITDANGRTVYSSSIAAPTDEWQTISLESAQLPPGIYVVQIFGAGCSKSWKWVISQH